MDDKVKLDNILRGSILDLVETLPFDYSEKAAFYRIYDLIPENYTGLIPTFVEIMSSLILLSKNKNESVPENAERKDMYKL